MKNILSKLTHLLKSQSVCHVLKRNLVQRSVLASDFNYKTAPKLHLKLDQNAGLFGIPELTDHSGLHLLKEEVEKQVDVLLQEAQSPDRSRKMVEVFDELSNCLCRIADMSDFIQVAHPNKLYRDSAEQTCVSLARLVERLNTNQDLYTSLRSVIDKGDKLATDEVDERVAKLFLFDFEQSGIHLDEFTRRSFVTFNESILMLGTYFSQAAQQPSVTPVSLMPKHLLKHFPVQGDNVCLTGLYYDHPDSQVREVAYRMYLHPDPHRLDLLKSLLSLRHQLAQLIEFPTYAHRALSGTLGHSPENVGEFLDCLSSEMMPRTRADMKCMAEMRDRLHGGTDGPLQPWDHPYLSAVCRQEQYNIRMADIMPYLSLGCCMEGLNNLFRQLFGVSLQKVEPEEGEVWHEDIHKLAVVEDRTGVLGYIFCDFFERADKPNQDCHFTIRGGRQSSPDTYQLPVVVLFLNFPQPSPSVPALLTPGMLENLFHEFGHAMHSMLGRTKYQHVTGTRCPTDFAEIPALLMEYFVQSEKVVTSFARHYKTGEPMPAAMLERVCHAKRLLAASDMQVQIFYSVLDQQYHSARPETESTTDILSEVQHKYYGIPHAAGTAWHTRFNHLVTYGAKYYAYLMARAVAARIWRQCFINDPFNREMGERYRREMLEHGGGCHPRLLIQGMLGENVTVDRLVGSLVDDISS